MKVQDQHKIKPNTQSCQTSVSGSVFRPKNGYELLQALKENKQCEVVDTHAFLAAKALEDNHIAYRDYLKREELSIKNAVPTALVI